MYEAMKKACVLALADLAMAEPSEVVTAAYGGKAIFVVMPNMEAKNVALDQSLSYRLPLIHVY